jgi:beta-ketodecanoyl-[acyl-carrier-protein] synthase
VGPEITSAHLEWRDRDCHFIFGDVLDRGAAGKRAIGLGDPRYRRRRRDKTFRQEGRKVFKEVVPMAAAHIEAT